jgi:hypothetical protein
MPQNLFSGRFSLPQKVHIIKPKLLLRHLDSPAFEQQLSSVMRISVGVLQGLRAKTVRKSLVN